MTAYIANDGRILFIHDGISDGKTWATYYRKSPTHRKRLISPALPLRETREQAQADLDGYAVNHCYYEYEGPVCRVCGCTDHDACPGGCWWVEDPEGIGELCSACLPGVLRKMQAKAGEPK
jgi:hypothetical protein